ncbi:MAG: nucleotide pyrophosphohydrolase [Rhizobacter sp.]
MNGLVVGRRGVGGGQRGAGEGHGGGAQERGKQRSLYRERHACAPCESFGSSLARWPVTATTEDEGMNLSELQAELRHFAAERDWQPFHTPKNLSTALMVEAAELAEIFQWMTPEQSQAANLDPVKKGQIAHEVADVLLYLLQVADHCQVDIAQATAEKLSRNAQKYPPLRAIARVSPTNAVLPGVHVLLDYENVQPTEAALRELIPDVSQVWVFHGPHQRQAEQRFAGFGEAATAIPISKTGKNALDFHLSFYMGYIASRNPSATLVVVSNDKGFEPMLAHARDLGFAARQVGYGKTRQTTAAKAIAKTPAAKKAPAKKAAAKKTVAEPKVVAAKKVAAKKVAPAKKTAAAKKAAPAKVVAPAKVPAKAKAPTPKASAPVQAPARKATKAGVADAASHKRLVDALRKTGDARPTKTQSLWRLLKSLLGAQATDYAVDDALSRLISEGVVKVNSVTGVSYPVFSR